MINGIYLMDDRYLIKWYDFSDQFIGIFEQTGTIYFVSIFLGTVKN